MLDKTNITKAGKIMESIDTNAGFSEKPYTAITIPHIHPNLSKPQFPSGTIKSSNAENTSQAVASLPIRTINSQN